MSGKVSPKLWTRSRCDAADWNARETVEAGREFCTRHREDPRAVVWVEYDVIDMPLLRFGIYLADDDGRPPPGLRPMSTIGPAMVTAIRRLEDWVDRQGQRLCDRIHRATVRECIRAGLPIPPPPNVAARRAEQRARRR